MGLDWREGGRVFALRSGSRPGRDGVEKTEKTKEGKSYEYWAVL